jgi:molybdate/tungstate transport system ATP-binding protein
VTFFMVIHDFSEALSLADRAAVINNGRIVQVDSVQNIFRRPATSFVAGFVGMKNIFAVEYRGTAAVIAGKLSIETGRSHNRSRGYIAVRPEDIVISRTPLTSSMRNSLAATVTDVFDQGFFTDVELDIGGTAFSALITKGSLVELDIRPGVRVYASFKATALHNL